MIKVIGLAALQGRIDKSIKKLGNRKKANASAVAYIDKWIQKNFASEGEPVGGWAPLSAATQAMRRTGKKGTKGNKTLQDTGALKTRWRHFYNRKIGKLTSAVKYGIFHHAEKRNNTSLPRRQILPDNKHVEQKLLQIYGHAVRVAISND